MALDRVGDAHAAYTAGTVTQELRYLKRTGGVWGASAAWTNSAASIAGLACYHQGDWNAVVDKALKEGDWVIQEQVSVPAMTVPEIVNQKLDFVYKKFNFNMLVFGGKYAGSFVRLSDESVINVATGGGLMPALWSDVAPEHFGA